MFYLSSTMDMDLSAINTGIFRRFPTQALTKHIFSYLQHLWVYYHHPLGPNMVNIAPNKVGIILTRSIIKTTFEQNSKF